MAGTKIIFGGARVNPQRGFDDADAMCQAMDILTCHGIDTIDTARAYGESESILGDAGAASKFLIDTKVPGGLIPGSLRSGEVWESLRTSLLNLKTQKVNIFYIHNPDASVPIEDTLASVNDLHRAGYFSKFGLCNFLPEDVEKIHEYCQTQGFVLPTVYQGNYNPVARHAEDVLLPILRRLGISFYAYSPIAGGFLAKTKQQIMDGDGRFRKGSSYWTLYANECHFEALESWRALAENANCEPAELAYRWVAFNSCLKAKHGDGLIFGARGALQLKQDLSWLNKGPLSGEVCSRVDEIWLKVQQEDPWDRFEE